MLKWSELTPVDEPAIDPHETTAAHDASDVRAEAFTLGQAIRLTGEIAVDGPLCINGHVEGKITASGCVTIAVGSRVNATLECGELVVKGCLIGNVSADRVVIASSGFMLGEICAPCVVIADGAKFEGHVREAGDPESGEAAARPVGVHGIPVCDSVFRHEVERAVGQAFVRP